MATPEKFSNALPVLLINDDWTLVDIGLARCPCWLDSAAKAPPRVLTEAEVEAVEVENAAARGVAGRGSLRRPGPKTARWRCSPAQENPEPREEIRVTPKRADQLKC